MLSEPRPIPDGNGETKIDVDLIRPRAELIDGSNGHALEAVRSVWRLDKALVAWAGSDCLFQPRITHVGTPAHLSGLTIAKRVLLAFERREVFLGRFFRDCVPALARP